MGILAGAIDAESLAAGLITAAELIRRRSRGEVSIEEWITEQAAALTQMGDPSAVGLGAANEPRLLLAANPNRKRWGVQYIGPGGECRLHTRATIDGGWKLAPDDSFFDDPPDIHKGDIYAHATVANAVIIVSEWA